jgi:predicted naringenin-chalcone synthase
MNEADLLSIAIFSDGAAAAIVGGANVAAACAASRASAAGKGGSHSVQARILATRSSVLHAPGGESTVDDMWLRETGFRPDGSIYGQNFVSKAVPKHLLRSLPGFVSALMDDAAKARTQAGLLGEVDKLADMSFLCHPGGPAILDVAARALRLQPWQLDASWHVLRARGNMSGATNMFVLHHWLTNGAPGAAHAAGVAFGPGLAVEGIVMEALRDMDTQ